MIKIKKFKTFISIFLTSILLLSFLLPELNKDSYLAATRASETTTRKKPVGHKVEGAEYYDELWEKFSVIAVDNGGGSGEGGGAGDANSNNAGNSGTYDDYGGSLGQAAGTGLGTGNTQNQAGSGSGTSGGFTGSATADAIRALKAKIEKEREESIAKVLETANNAKAAMESIKKRESEQASIQKKMQQESVRAKIAAAEQPTLKQYETPVYVEQTERKKIEYETKRIDAPSDIEEANVYDDFNIAPTERSIQRITLIESIVPVADRKSIEAVESIVPVADEDQEVEENINAPTSESRESQSETVAETTLKMYDSPIMPEENNVAKESIAPSETHKASENDSSQNQELKLEASDLEEGRGSKGGQDSELDKDHKGDDGENESEGNAEEQGEFQFETEGNYAGKKVFELDRNGNLGLDKEHLAATSMRGLFTAVLILLLSLGALIFIANTKDRVKRNNYF